MVLETYKELVGNEYTRIFEFRDEKGKMYVQICVSTYDLFKPSTFRFFKDHEFELISIGANCGWTTMVWKKYLE